MKTITDEQYQAVKAAWALLIYKVKDVNCSLDEFEAIKEAELILKRLATQEFRPVIVLKENNGDPEIWSNDLDQAQVIKVFNYKCTAARELDAAVRNSLFEYVGAVDGVVHLGDPTPYLRAALDHDLRKILEIREVSEGIVMLHEIVTGVGSGPRNQVGPKEFRETAAAFVVRWAEDRQDDMEFVDLARKFCAQWSEGPQVP